MGRRFHDYKKPTQITFHVDEVCYNLGIVKEKFTEEALEVLEEISKLRETDHLNDTKKRKRSRSPRRIPQERCELVSNTQTLNKNNLLETTDSEFETFINGNDFISSQETEMKNTISFDEGNMSSASDDFIWASIAEISFEFDEQMWNQDF